ncbi:MAG: hypothetical protein LH610_08450 [Sphingomonas bacterium]|nr:hypothetical protein [Sphingomonas bacterium]
MKRRDDADLLFADDRFVGTVLLDTTVYIDALHDRLPATVESLLRTATLLHSTIARSELAVAFGRLKPADPRTAPTLEKVGAVIDAIPSHRLETPSARATIQGGISTGAISRLRGMAEDQRRKLFNDAQLFFQALELGAFWLTANISDADLLQQLAPSGRVLLYRKP